MITIYKTILIMYYGHQCYQYVSIAQTSYNIMSNLYYWSGKLYSYVHITPEYKNELNETPDEWVFVDK